MSALTKIRRYGRAFWLALKYTARGEKPPLLKVHDQHPELSSWWTKTLALVAAVERTAEAGGITPQSVTVRVDKRSLSMKTILGTIRFHAERDYPYLIAHHEQYDRMALEAINLNDRYLIMQLGNQVDASLNPAVDTLSTHLASLPPSSTSTSQEV